MDYNNLKTVFFTITVIHWCDVFNEGVCSFRTHATPVVTDSDPCQSSPTSEPTTEASPTSPVSDPTQASLTSMKELKPLPDKGDSFFTIRRDNKVFIDKTPYIEQLLKEGRNCVLFTRPRRFGKSNFLQMLESFFSGEKEMFKDTKIYSRGNTDEKGDKWVKYPVVKLSFADIAAYGAREPSAELFTKRLYDVLQEIGDSYGVGDFDQSMSTLIRKLHRQFSLPVVILIDEYDYPFTRILHERPDGSLTKEEVEMLKGMKRTLDAFFNAIKSQIEERDHVKLAFVTGVARFSFESLPGSGPNNVVTLTNKYSCMVGFTEDEISRFLRPYIDQLAEKEVTSPEEITQQLLKMYGGYLFSDTDGGTKVLNPVSVVQCLENQQFSNYWCPTHSLDVVLEKMYADEARPDQFIRRKVPVAALYERNPTYNAIPTSIYMLVYGYLTVEEYNRRDKTVILNYPNDYMRELIENNFKIRILLDHEDEFRRGGNDIAFFLESELISALVKFLNKLGFRNQAPAPYQLRIEHEFTATTILYLIFRTVGLNVEIGTKMTHNNCPLDDLDLLIMTETMNFVIEVKYEKKDELEGLKQLLGYITKAEDTFLGYIAKRRHQHKLRKTSTTYLLALNFKKDKSGSTYSINSFVAIPYQPEKPCGNEEAVKIWFNQMQSTSDTQSIIQNLKGEFEVPLSGRAVWE